MISSLLSLAGLFLAQAAPSGSSGGPFGGGIIGIVPWVLVFGIFYMLLIRPQQKKQRELQDWLKNLKKGDEVVTTGGLVGKISGLNDQIVTLELQEKVRVRVLRSHIAGKPPAPEGKENKASEASK